MKISFAMNEKKMWPSVNLWVLKSDDIGCHVKNLQYLGKIINIAPGQNSNQSPQNFPTALPALKPGHFVNNK